MVTVLANLNARYDDSGPDEPLSFKKTIASPYWKNFEKAMYAEFQSLIEKGMIFGRIKTHPQAEQF